MEKISFGTSEQGITKEITCPVPWGIVSGKTYGEPPDDPVLCMHGLQDNCNTFDELIPYLPKGKFYVMIDLPGHGVSSPLHLGMSYSYYMFIDTVERVAQYFGWKTFSTLGHSLGGNVGALYAAAFPEKVDKVILIDVIGFFPRATEILPSRLRRSIVTCIEFEKNPMKYEIGYNYDQAKRRLLAANTSLTDKAADILLERGTKRRKDGTYSYNRDPRLKLPFPVGLTLEIGVGFMSKIEAECMHILAKDGGVLNVATHPNIKAMLDDAFPSSQYHEVIEVEGKHHVHLCNPEVVADHIKRFLLRPKRFGLAKSSVTSNL